MLFLRRNIIQFQQPIAVELQLSKYRGTNPLAKNTQKSKQKSQTSQNHIKIRKFSNNLDDTIYEKQSIHRNPNPYVHVFSYYQLIIYFKMKTETWIQILKWINIVAAVVIGAMGIYQLVTFQIFSDFAYYKVWSIFTPLYSLLFCGMLLALEFKRDFIADQFQFMMSCFGRGIFYIFLGSVVSYQPNGGDSEQVAGWIWGITLWLVGIFFVVIHFCGPEGSQGALKDAVQTEYGTS